MLADGVRLHVEEGRVEPHEAEEAADQEEHVRGFAEGGPVDETSAGGGQYTDFHDQVGHQ